ncbi:MAG TPA: shikimate kinase [Pyrinomonadaceae bacterium]
MAGHVRAGAASESDTPDAPPRVVVITGFMGAGKSTVARELGRRLSCLVIDLDDLITGRAGRTPRELIDEEGETHFRELETDALREAMTGDGSVVVATGGGAWAHARNRSLADARGCLTVWLDAPFELCWRRITNAPGTRPLARDETQARRLFDERRATYSLARLRVEVRDDTTPETLSAAIADALEIDGSTHE